MHVAQTKDTMSDLYLDAVRLRQRVFVAEQGVPEEMEIDDTTFSKIMNEEVERITKEECSTIEP